MAEEQDDYGLTPEAMIELAAKGAEHLEACAEAIENTAAQLGVDPVALAEDARDGKWVAFAVEFTEQCLREDQESMAGLSPPEGDWLDKLADVRARSASEGGE